MSRVGEVGKMEGQGEGGGKEEEVVRAERKGEDAERCECREEEWGRDEMKR